MKNKEEKLKIFTYCTDINNKNYKKLSRQLDVDLLPELIPWTPDFFPKSYSLYNVLQNEDTETIVLVCDAYDVLPWSGVTNEILLESIIKYFDLEKITFNAEKNCYPNVGLKSLYPEVDSIWKFLNAGLYVGKVKHILKMLEKNLPRMRGIIDQEIFSLDYVNKEMNIEIDYNCKIFQTMYMLDDEDLSIKDNQVINNKTQSNPILFHGNGNSSFKKIFEHDN